MTTTEPFLRRIQEVQALQIKAERPDTHADLLLKDMEAAFTRSTFVRVEDLAGIKEIAEFFDVGRSTVSQWASRRSANKMPEPLKTIGGGTLYDLQAVVEWWKNWKPTQGAKSGTLPLNYYSEE
jgi:hypothetical protein